MCGIAGVVGPGAHEHAEQVAAMVRALGHRGPDGQGLAVFDDAVLGHARLSVIGGDRAHQPLLDRTDTTAMVCNGEIYGHQRLRRSLRSYPFRTDSDCEVVLALYDAHGHDLLRRLPGTFAFALWDDRRSSLLLARDRFGERPLYYTFTATGQLVFASESRALRMAGFAPSTPDLAMVSEMLRQGYVPSSRSVWKGIQSVPHAGALTWNLDGEPRLRRWWRPPEVRDDVSAEAATDWFSTELNRAVQEQVEAEVPVGAFLSGGIDSATVTALAARHAPSLEVFSFDMPGESEIEFAQAIAERHHLSLHVLRPDESALVDEMLTLADAYDEPFGDSSALPTRMLCRLARERVGVVLTGDGADELLGGYLVWVRDMLTPADGGATVEATPSRLRGTRTAWQTLKGRALLASRRNGSSVANRYAKFRNYFDSTDLACLGLPDATAQLVDLRPYWRGGVDDILRFDLDHYLPGDILVKSDRASMEHGLEVRAPFLDVRVAEGCLELPAHHKVDAQAEKLLLRRAFGDLWPASVAARRKQGFGSPLGSWLSLPEVDALKREHLLDGRSALFDLVDQETVGKFAHQNDQRTWNLLALSLWWQRCKSDVVVA